MTAATTTFVAQLANARVVAYAANQAVNDALKNCTLDAHFQRMALALKDPTSYATCLRKIAAIVETLPALRQAAAEAAAALAPLEERACRKCHGTGEYSAPTSAYRNGRPYCFKCNGTGETF